jgi:hypothetical protein
MDVLSRGRRAAVLVLATVAVVGPLAACGGDDGASAAATAAAPTTTSPLEAMCADRDALVASVRDLTDLDIIATGTDGIREALTDVQDRLEDLRGSAADFVEPEVDALGDALQTLEGALGEMSFDGVTEIVSAASDVVSAGGDLVERLQSIDCG